MKILSLILIVSFLTLPLLSSISPDEQLFRAVQADDIEQAQEALGAGANINAHKAWIYHLHTAVYDENINILKFLLESGANVNIQNGVGRAPLHYAMFSKNIEIVKLLIEAGADVTARDKHGNTPLHEATYSNNIKIVKHLLEAGAQVNAKNYHGETPLHKASILHKTDIVKFLLDVEADSNAQDYDGYTPLDLASGDILALLEDHAKLLEQIQLRPTKELLTQAIDLGYVYAVKLLLQAAIKPDLQDLALAKQKHDQENRPLYKESYKAIGRMLLQHLRLAGELQALPNNNAFIANFYRWIMSLFWPFGSTTTDHAYGPLSKAGLSLPENVAHTIASFTHK